MAIGLQYIPPLATVANAAASDSGAISFVPRIAAGFGESSPPSARCTPIESAVSRMAHRSSLCAMDANAELIEARVAVMTEVVIEPPAPP